MGKTTSLISIATWLGDQGCKFAFYGLEMTNIQLGDRVVANMGGIDLSSIRDLSFTEDEFNAIESEAKNIRKWEGYWAEKGSGYIEEIKQIIDKKGIEVVIIDYVQLMATKTRSGRTERLEEISRQMKLLTMQAAAESGVTVITAAQGNMEKIGDVQKVTGKVFGSSAFVRDADMLLTLNYVYDDLGEEVPGLREVQIIASRVSGTATFQIRFSGHQAKLGSIQEMEEPEQVDIYQASFDI